MVAAKKGIGPTSFPIIIILQYLCGLQAKDFSSIIEKAYDSYFSLTHRSAVSSLLEGQLFKELNDLFSS